MTIAELLLPEVDQELATTRRVLERVSDAALGWKPHDKSWSMGALASHIVNMIKWTEATMNMTEFDVATVPPDPSAASRAQLLEWFDVNAAAARAAMQKSDAEYFVPWSLKHNGRVIFTMPRYTCVR